MGYATAARGPSETRPCPVGEDRLLDPGLIKIGVHAVTTPVLIGCGDLRHEGAVEFVAYREGPSLDSSELCVDTHFAGGGLLGTCAEADKRIHGLGTWVGGDAKVTLAFSGYIRRWLLFHDFVGLGIAEIRLRYRSYGVVRRPRAVLTRVSDPSLLATLALKKPFLYYTAEASNRGRSILVLARNKSGKLISWRSVPEALIRR